jgi:hypothetical protein
MLSAMLGLFTVFSLFSARVPLFNSFGENGHLGYSNFFEKVKRILGNVGVQNESIQIILLSGEKSSFVLRVILSYRNDLQVFMTI